MSQRESTMITGVHAIMYAPEAERTRAFLRDVLGFDHVDAGEGWLIFALPPAEVGVHPTEGRPGHELYLLCDDLATTMNELAADGAEFVGEPEHQGWGVLARLRVPGGGEIGLYEPAHPTAIGDDRPVS